MEGSTGNVWNCILKFWCLALLRFPPRAAIWAWLQLSWIFVGHLGTCGLSLPLNFHPLIWLFRFYLFVRVSNVFSSLFFFYKFESLSFHLFIWQAFQQPWAWPHPAIQGILFSWSHTRSKQRSERPQHSLHPWIWVSEGFNHDRNNNSTTNNW